MATFKVGQRVRHVADLRREDRRGWPTTTLDNGIGDVGTVVAPDSSCLMPVGTIAVLFDNDRSDHRLGIFAMYPYQLAPLTDPGADAFIERIKKLKPYDEPVRKTVVHDLPPHSGHEWKTTPSACR